MPMPIALHETEVPGVLEVQTKEFGDARGFFSELYNREVWREAGFDPVFVQDNLSRSCKGTLRGMHYQIEPHGMGKLVRAVTGAVFDVAIDLRKGSPTFGQWVGRELRAGDARWLWIPAGFAHGFLALADDTLVYYKCTATHHPDSERAIAYNDPAVGIVWPAAPAVISEKDAAAPSFSEAEHNFSYTG